MITLKSEREIKAMQESGELLAGKELSTKELNKFYKYLNLEFKNNNSKNNLDNRLNSFYKIIQKQYDDFIKLNDIITQLD